MGIQDSMNAIIEQMNKKHIGKSQIARHLKLTPNAVYRWFNGDCEPTLYHLVEMIDYVGLTIEVKNGQEEKKN